MRKKPFFFFFETLPPAPTDIYVSSPLSHSCDDVKCHPATKFSQSKSKLDGIPRVHVQHIWHAWRNYKQRKHFPIPRSPVANRPNQIYHQCVDVIVDSVTSGVLLSSTSRYTPYVHRAATTIGTAAHLKRKRIDQMSRWTNSRWMVPGGFDAYGVSDIRPWPGVLGNALIWSGPVHNCCECKQVFLWERQLYIKKYQIRSSTVEANLKRVPKSFTVFERKKRYLTITGTVLKRLLGCRGNGSSGRKKEKHRQQCRLFLITNAPYEACDHLTNFLSGVFVSTGSDVRC